MAVTKILARHARLDLAINYAVNPDKTDEEVLTAYLNCDKGHACHQMLATKEAKNNRDGVQYYHIIQSFKPGEITPELALEIAKAFAKDHLADYEVVIGVHVDKEHIHAHMVFNSVNLVTGRKYHSNAKSYYQQIRGISDKLCREHGLSVIMEGKPSKAVSYIEWLRQSKGQPTFRSMLEADLRDAIADANDLGHFFLLMEHKGYEIHHGNRLGFRLRGQERFMYWTDIMLTGLGAIMDVAVTISAATGEIVRKNPDVSLRKLIHSGREIGYDIMGTMINVLLFVLASGMIPMFILKMNNDVSFITIVRYHIPYDICRFLIESIGIVLAIPVSVFKYCFSNFFVVFSLCGVTSAFSIWYFSILASNSSLISGAFP